MKDLYIIIMVSYFILSVTSIVIFIIRKIRINKITFKVKDNLLKLNELFSYSVLIKNIEKNEYFTAYENEELILYKNKKRILKDIDIILLKKDYIDEKRDAIRETVKQKDADFKDKTSIIMISFNPDNFSSQKSLIRWYGERMDGILLEMILDLKQNRAFLPNELNEDDYYRLLISSLLKV
jgi:hypothetical protein